MTCENDGKCMLTGMDSYVCSCKQGYSGDHCELGEIFVVIFLVGFDPINKLFPLIL